MSAPSSTPSRFDFDPEALAWARAKIQREYERARDMERKSAEPTLWRFLANALRRNLIGGTGCVIGAFDERLPQVLAAAEDEVPL